MVRILKILGATALLAGCSILPTAADPASDAPDVRIVAPGPLIRYASYSEALSAWQGPADVSAWIGATLEYDVDRAALLSETQRADRPGPAIIEPEAFFARPKGVCVDLARFAVETLRRVSPGLNARYLMLEFDPALLRGQVLRRHWVVSFETGEGVMVMADSKRPGLISGPYTSLEEFLKEYAAYRGRSIVSHRESDSYSRTIKAASPRRRHG